MKNDKIFEALQAQFDSQADDKAGYPPNCKEGYVAKDGKCVPVEENSAKKNDNDKEKNGDDEEKNGDDKKKNGNPFDKKKKK